MLSPLPSVSDADRLAVLRSYDIVDTGIEPAFNDIVTLAREVCHTPVALISFVEAERQWFKAAAGLSVCETPLDQSVCAHAIRQHGTLVIRDLSKDARTKMNPLVTGEPHIRFYAGALLKTPSGVPLGTVCVVDLKPRPEGLTPAQIECLEALARRAMTQLELRRDAAEKRAMAAEQKIAVDVSVARALETERLAVLLKASEARLRLAQQIGDIGSFEIEMQTGKMQVTEWFCRLLGMPYRTNYNYSDLLPLVFAEDRAKMLDGALRADRSQNLFAEYRIKRADTGETRWIARHAEYVRDEAGLPLRLVGTLRDITVQKTANAQQAMLNQELSHRMKNTMALVQAIARQTLRGTADREAAIHAFDQRIIALSSAHDVLLKQSWLAADLRLVVARILPLHADLARFSITGPAVTLGPKATLSLSLLLHELATNAVKYGSLSVPAGRVAIDWEIEGDDLVLQWHETGGPAPPPESGKPGLGSRLIKMGLAGTGRVETTYTSSGLTATFRAALKIVKEN